MNYTKEQLTDLRDAITAYLEGRPVQFRRIENNRLPEDGWVEAYYPMFDATEYEYRPKPQSKTRFWNCPADVPGPVCWLRLRGQTDIAWMVAGVCPNGIHLPSSVTASYLKEWEQMSGMEYSTDRETWHPCVVNEP